MKHAKMKNYVSEQTNSNNSEFRYHVNLRYFRYLYLVDDKSLLQLDANLSLNIYDYLKGKFQMIRWPQKMANLDTYQGMEHCQKMNTIIKKSKRKNVINSFG